MEEQRGTPPTEISEKSRDESKPTVLVVDDEADLSELYAVHLDDEYEVRTANSGEEALDVLDDSVDVVLLDRGMPGLDGDEVLRRIRDSELDCRVALVTAFDPEFDIVEMGFDAYVCKPVSRRVLRETVSVLLRRHEYDSHVRKYFSLLSKRAVLEQEKTAAELSTNDVYADLCTEIDERRGRTNRLLDEFDEEDFLVAFHDLNGTETDDYER